jgi:hypothetical protein
MSYALWSRGFFDWAEAAIGAIKTVATRHDMRRCMVISVKQKFSQLIGRAGGRIEQIENLMRRARGGESKRRREMVLPPFYGHGFRQH